MTSPKRYPWRTGAIVSIEKTARGRFLISVEVRERDGLRIAKEIIGMIDQKSGVKGGAE